MIYFACYPKGNRKRITVIDLDHFVSYERDEWDCVDPHNYDTRNEAIKHARYLANKYGLEYIMFESRYDKETNEYLDEFSEEGHYRGDNNEEERF